MSNSKREMRLDVRDSVATVHFAWPQAANSIDLDFPVEFNRILDRITANREVRAVVLSGDGKVFNAGGDLDKLSDSGVDPAWIRDCNRVVKRLHYFDLPVVGAINGPAVGGGVGVALACDFAIASESARYDLLFHRVGLCAADVGVTWFLNRALGPQLASYYVLTGGTIDAGTGLRLGLFAQVVPAAELLQTAHAAAARIVAAPDAAVRLSKLSLRRNMDMNLDTALEFETYLQGFAFQTPEHKQRVAELRARIASKNK
jgi:2-(1,2-epoxy-1,2-dihydrophenyl)acetyl-CoA isomerase